MKIARLFGAAAAAVTMTGALVALAVPASGQDLLNPDIVPAMQRDLGLTHDQVLTRLKSEDVANKVTEAVSATLGDAFGGATYNAATGKAHIQTTNAAEVAKIQSSGAEAEVVKFSARQLDSTVDTLNARDNAAPYAITGWGVDSATNRVTVTVLQGQRGTADAFLAQSGVDKSSITILEAASKPTLHANIRGGDAYYIGGSSRCSVGFSTTTGFLDRGALRRADRRRPADRFQRRRARLVGRLPVPGQRLREGEHEQRLDPAGLDEQGTAVRGPRTRRPARRSARPARPPAGPAAPSAPRTRASATPRARSTA